MKVHGGGDEERKDTTSMIPYDTMLRIISVYIVSGRKCMLLGISADSWSLGGNFNEPITISSMKFLSMMTIGTGENLTSYVEEG